MPVLADVDLDWDAVRQRVAAIGRAGGRRREWGPALDVAVAEARTLVRPAIAYEVLPVLEAIGERLLVGDGRALESPVVAELFRSAPEVVLMAYTIGPLLEAQVAELGRANEPLAAFALDMTGSVAVNQVGVAGYELIEGLARERGVRASIPLNPGTSHWPMSGQRLIAELTGADRIGVQALESGILRPFKTIAFAVALGRDVPTPAEASSCDYCDRRDLCRA